MFDLIEQPVNEPELTQREKAAIEEVRRWKDKRIEDAVYMRMLDPEYIIDAIQICLKDNVSTQNRMADLIMGHGDRINNITSIKLDVRDWITHQVTKEAERGVL